MLILTRKKGEIITIGKSIEIKVIDDNKGLITLGIVAPKNIPVHRKEIFDAIVEQNKQSTKNDVTKLKQALIKTTIVTDNTKNKI